MIQKREGPGDGVLIRKLDKEIAKLLELEDIKWQQRAKSNWYSLDDQKKRFFHA